MLQNLKLSKSIIFFDLETTGTDISKDRIVELAVLKINPDGSFESHSRRFNPGIPIPPEATAVHGICDDGVKDQPSFSRHAAKLALFFKDADIGGFNILRFDLPLLVEEFLRAGVAAPFDSNTRYVDAMAIFHKMEKRDLSAAYKFYCNKEMQDAHQAKADVLASLEVFDAQISHYDLKADIESLHTFCNDGKQIVDFAGNFKYDDSGTIIFSFGKNKGKSAVSDRGYLEWMLKSDFTADTKRWCRHLLSSIA